MQKIIFNADDLGLSRGVNAGILHCYKNGVVNSASLMTTTVYFDETVSLIQENQLENIGLHFNLTEGPSLLGNHKSIVNTHGMFERDICNIDNLDLNEVYKEVEAQYFRAIEAGVTINHLDSHHHIHMSYKLRKVFLEFSKRHSLPLRKIDNTARNPLRIFEFYRDTRHAIFLTQKFTAEFYDDKVSESTLMNILNTNKDNNLEIMCHPGYIDAENGVYDENRLKELDILCSTTIKQSLLRNFKL